MQFTYLKHDIYRYIYPDDSVNKVRFLKKIKIIISTQAIWAIIVYRLSRWTFYECRYRLVRRLLKPFIFFLQIAVQVLTGIQLDPSIDIGPGFYIGHFGNIILGGDIRIGKFCNISQGNTFGIAGRGDDRGLPELGDFVYVAPGAKVIGKIKIGSHVAIGANAVVTKDLPDNAVAVGIPAKVISYKSSRDFVNYNRIKSKEVL